MGTVVEKILSTKSGLNEAFMSLLKGFEVCDIMFFSYVLFAKMRLFIGSSPRDSGWLPLGSESEDQKFIQGFNLMNLNTGCFPRGYFPDYGYCRTPAEA